MLVLTNLIDSLLQHDSTHYIHCMIGASHYSTSHCIRATSLATAANDSYSFSSVLYMTGSLSLSTYCTCYFIHSPITHAWLVIPKPDL